MLYIFLKNHFQINYITVYLLKILINNKFEPKLEFNY